MHPVQNIQFSAIDIIADHYEGILLDAYGVFWGGNACGALPGAIEVMKRLVERNKIVGILSNTTALPHKEIDKLAKHEIRQNEHFHFFLTSGLVARQMFQQEILPFPTPKGHYWLFGGVHPQFPNHLPIFENSRYREAESIQDADFIYLAVPHIQGQDQTDPELFREAIRAVIPYKLPMFCSNPDQFAHEGNPPRLVVRQGSIAALYTEMGGKVFYVGKPDVKVFEAAMKEFSHHNVIDKKKVIMIGDNPETDIRGANVFGIDSALVLETGMMHERAKAGSMQELIGRLPQDDQPNYFLRSLSHVI